MDHEQFAALTRLVAARGSRRGALLALLGAAVFGHEPSLEAEAKGKGGRDGGKRHGRNRGNGRHSPGRRKGRGRHKNGKAKTSCAGVGELSAPEKPCCQDLVLDADGRCIAPPTPGCADTCDGCCDGETCITAVSGQACGANGSPCVQCSATQTCGGCEPGVCGERIVCKPLSCAEVGATCGQQSDGCGGVIPCGVCTAPQFCGGGGPSICGGDSSGPIPPACAPRTCAAQGVNCGPIANGCGGLLNCGACPAGQFCVRNTCRAGVC